MKTVDVAVAAFALSFGLAILSLGKHHPEVFVAIGSMFLVTLVTYVICRLSQSQESLFKPHGEFHSPSGNGSY